ncbi:MAG: glycosyltransferase family 39 protein [Candidatus Moraniibacteriota bacterium]
MDFLKKRAYWIVAGILLLHFAVSLLVSSQESAIYDEKAHIPAAYSSVRYGDMRLNFEHPPLIKDLSGLALLPLRPAFPLQSAEWQQGVNEQWVIGDMFLSCTRPDVACNDADAILFWSRLPIILLSVMLGVVLFIWTRELGGTLAGLFAVLLYAADPNIIAHNHYVTTDLGIAAFVFFAFYFFVRFLKAPSLKNTVVAGIFLGLAELTKFSAILLFPVFGLFVIIYALTKVRLATDTRSMAVVRIRALFSYGLKFLGSVAVCFAIIWSLYAWNIAAMPTEKIVAIADFTLGQDNAPARLAHSFVIRTSENDFLRPLSYYFLGVFKVLARVSAGNDYYFLGHIDKIASPWYFPIVFALKETLPLLLLLIFTACYSLYRIGAAIAAEHVRSLSSLSAFIGRSFRGKTAQYVIVFFVLFYSLVSITGNLTIGFRHLFPILPFLYMLIAKSVFDFLRRRRTEPVTHAVCSWIFGITVFAIAAIPVLTYPGYLSYFNPIIGGNQNGYRYVTDSNYDWGQDLKNLNDFVETHNRCKAGMASQSEVTKCAVTADYPAIDKIRVDHFGGGSPRYYLTDKYISWWDKREPEAGWYAISSFFYQESLYKQKPAGDSDYSWLKGIQPITRAGDSIFIYYIPETGMRDNR